MKAKKKTYVACVSDSEDSNGGPTMIKYSAKNDKEFYLKLIEDVFGEFEDDEWEVFDKKSGKDLALLIENELGPFEGVYIIAMMVDTGRKLLGE